MNAREMFEELGYSLKVEHNDFIEYSKEDCGHIDFYFLIETKRFYSRYCFSPSFQSTAHSITLDEFEAVQKQMEELGWLEKEERAETNYEHFKDEIIENCGWTLALVDGKPHKCNSVNCSDCGFSTGHGCSEKLKEWLVSTYEKTTYKLTRFELDLIQTYRDCHESCKFSEFKQLIELKSKGYFKDIDDNTNIQDVLKNCEVIK